MIFGLDTTFLVQCDIREHPGHQDARKFLLSRIEGGDMFALAPQTLCEYLHITTDPRRFRLPLTMDSAMKKTETWWFAAEVRGVFPGEETFTVFRNWMGDQNLGRKRILDTMLAATYFTNGMMTIISSNARDFSSYGVFTVLDPGGG